MPKKRPAKWGKPASSHIADSDSGGLAVKLGRPVLFILMSMKLRSWTEIGIVKKQTDLVACFAIDLDQRDQHEDAHLQEVSSGGFEVLRAQLIRPSQNRSFRTHVRLEEEQRLQGGSQILKISNQRQSTSKPITSSRTP